MPSPVCTEDQFIDLCRLHRSVTLVANALKLSERAVCARRRRVERKHGIRIDLGGTGMQPSPDKRPRQVRAAEAALAEELRTIAPKVATSKAQREKMRAPSNRPDDIEHFPSEWRYRMTVQDGTVVIGSDAHYAPGTISTAHRALVHLTAELKPVAVILNGDIYNASAANRHPRIRWHKPPSVKAEVEVCQERLGEIEAVLGNGKAIRTWGNHDSNFESKLSHLVPEYEGIGGFTLWEHLPRWQPCMSVFINDRPGGLVVKHRFKGGLHAPQNNALWAGRSMATGHLHSQKCYPLTDYNGTRYGVDLGCMAPTDADESFHYAEDDPRNWRSGFAVFTFRGGELMPPELVTVLGPRAVWFRGEVLTV